MKKLKYQPLLLLVLALVLALAGVWLFTYCRAKQRHGHRHIVSFATAKPVLEAGRERTVATELPPQLKEPSERNSKSWAQHEDNVVRARLVHARVTDLVVARDDD